MEQKYRDYLDLIEDAQAYNNFLFAERKLRLPFIDSQTGVAQNDCSLWRSQSERNYATDSDGRAGALYSYPASKWQKWRREYLMKSSLPSETIEQASRLPCTGGGAGEISTTNASLSNSNHLTYSAQQNNNNTSNSQNSSSPTPTRADSSGATHETCELSNMQDSDSRDTSHFATSRPFRYPSRNHNGDNNFSPADNCSSEPIVGKNRFNGHHQLNGLPKGSPKEQQQQQFEAQTKAAIRLHSKLSKKRKKRDAGQSLMRNTASDSSNSILIQNGRHKTDYYATINDEHFFAHSDKLNKTTERERQEFERGSHNNTVTHYNPKNEDINQTSHRGSPNGVYSLKSKAIITNGSRPYVCSICDQTYKTRPGLSYHFLHTHNTTLPKNLPNMRIVTRHLEHPNIDNSFRGSTSHNPNSGGGCNTANSNEKRRELIPVPVKASSRLLRSGRVTRLQERSYEIEEDDDDDDKTEEEDSGDIDQTNTQPEQSKAIRNENNSDHHVDCSIFLGDHEVKAEDPNKLTLAACNNIENNTDHSLTHSMRISDIKTAADEKVATIDDKGHQQCDNNLIEIYRKQNNLAPLKQPFDGDYINFNAKLAPGDDNEPVLQQNSFCDLLPSEAVVD